MPDETLANADAVMTRDPARPTADQEQELRAPDLRAHMPALDGLRGVAILMVLVFHFTVATNAPSPIERAVYATAHWMWVGVDLFFVLSGFLITGILLDSRGQARQLPNFYARRLLRIFPLYYVIVAFFTIVLPAVAPRLAKGDFAFDRPAWVYWLYVTNYATPLKGILRHAWSLAVEEQFYLVWPMLVLVLGRRGMTYVCVVVAVGSLVARCVAYRHWGNFDGLGTATQYRADALAIGALAACVARAPGGLLARRLAFDTSLLVGVVGLAMAPFVQHALGLPHGSANRTVGFTLIAMVFGGVLVRAITRGDLLHRLLATPALRAVGRYSYATYLLHLPIQTAVERVWRPRTFAAQLAFLVACGMLTLGASVASWHVLEQPILRLKRFFPVRH